MVRMSQMMTLACATICVAGAAASAADKAMTAVNAGMLAQPEVKMARSQMSLRQRVTNWNLTPSVFGTEGGDCDCLWENGEWDFRDAQASHEGGAFPQGVKAADDFYLCEGFVYDLESISGFLCTDSLEALTKARIELYSDCDGAPDELLYEFKNVTIRETGTIVDGFRLVEAEAIIANQGDPSQDSTNELACIRNIVLKGGTYWVAIVGISDNRCITMPNMCDSTFFATAGDGVIKGSVAHKIEGVDTGHWNQFDYSSSSWEPLDECCIGCTDLAFEVCAVPCKILIDNGGADAIDLNPDGSARRVGERSERSTSPSRNSRAADDFVAPPCADLLICYIEGCIYSNCLPTHDGNPGFTGWFEIYDNDCKWPSYVLGRDPVAQGSHTCVVDLGYSVTIDGRSGLTAYRVEFHDLAIRLEGGRQYWISLSAQDTFSQNERAYFCYNADCERECLVRFNPGVIIGGLRPDGLLRTQWESVGRDFSFLIAGEPAAVNGDSSIPTCTADFNRDGSASLEDLFQFLAAWFSGCP